MSAKFRLVLYHAFKRITQKKLWTITMVNLEIKLRYFYYLVLKKFRAFSLINSSHTQNILRNVKRVMQVVSYETLVKKFL